jgi:hypothetical protein
LAVCFFPPLSSDSSCYLYATITFSGKLLSVHTSGRRIDSLLHSSPSPRRQEGNKKKKDSEKIKMRPIKKEVKPWLAG